MDNKKYQVFISSTYSDLIEERRKILDVLLSADCIPAGMEAFVATDTEQFEVIKQVIDLCDYYVLIIGKRYGSVSPETNISYTEMEYNYAIEKGIPVLVFALDDLVELPPEKTETDPIKIEKLNAFRGKALSRRLATIWSTSQDLVGKLAISIMKAKNEMKRPGWQRAVDFDEASLRREIMQLQEKNEELNAIIIEKQKAIDSFMQQPDLAFDDCEVTIEYSYLAYGARSRQRCIGTKTVTLPELFKIISLEMMDVSITESAIAAVLEAKLIKISSAYFNDCQFVKSILNQFKALGLVDSFWHNENKNLYWKLTIKGRKLRNDMTLIYNSAQTV